MCVRVCVSVQLERRFLLLRSGERRPLELHALSGGSSKSNRYSCEYAAPETGQEEKAYERVTGERECLQHKRQEVHEVRAPVDASDVLVRVRDLREGGRDEEEERESDRRANQLEARALLHVTGRGLRVQRDALVAALAAQMPHSGAVEERFEQQRHGVLSHREPNAVPAEPLVFSRVVGRLAAVGRRVVDGIPEGGRLHPDAVDDPNGHQAYTIDDVVQAVGAQWPQDGHAALAGEDHVVVDGELVEHPEDGLRVPHVADERREPRRAGRQP